MEYGDELERMRDRRRLRKANERQSGPSSRTRRETDTAYAGTGGRRRMSGPEAERQRGASHSERRQPGNHDASELRGGNYDFEDSRRGSRSENYDDRQYAYDYDEYDEEYDSYYNDDYDGYGSREFEHHRGSREREASRGKAGQGKKGRSSGSQKGGKKVKKKKRRFLLLKILFLVAVIAAVYFVYKYRQTGTGYWTVAVFGVDSRDGSLEKGALSDVEMICVIDRGTGNIKLVSVFRDTYLEINPDGTYHKINEAYFKGGHEQAVQALERNLDLTIDDYATFNWKAVADAINILGGIDLEISDSEFKYINSFITATVESTGIGSHHLEHAGMNHLDGIQAVAYARLRLMDTDYNRTARQRLVIQLAMNKAKEADLKTLTALVQAILPQISTSIGIDDLLPMARNIRKYHIGETGGFPFSRGETHIGKRDCVIPLTLESNVIQLHQLLYGTENFQPSETVKQISAKVASDSGMGEVAENAPEAKILGQRALESSEAERSGNSESGSKNEGSSGGGGSGNPQQPAQTETPAVETEAVRNNSLENPEESSQEEESSAEESSAEESSAETVSSTEAVQEETTEAFIPPSEETEIGPGYMTETASETASEADSGPTLAETAAGPSAEEPPLEAGPGIS